MGHTDARMVERVYGRFSSPAELGRALVASTDGVRLMSGRTGHQGDFASPCDHPRVSEKRDDLLEKQPVCAVPRVRIELTTRGFSDPTQSTRASEKDADSARCCPANVRSFLAECARDAAVAFASA